MNNAAVTIDVPLEGVDAVTPEHWERVLSGKVVGTFLVSQAAPPLLRRSDYGWIVNVTSIAGLRQTGSSLPYAVSKAAVDHVTRILAKVQNSGVVYLVMADLYSGEETAMSRVRVHNFSVSLDGFGTGEGQSLEAPFGHAGTRLHEWFFPTRTFREMQGAQGGSTGLDDAFASNWNTGVGVEIMGRNKFGYQRGAWADEDWKGWWGDNPPFHTPVLILTHHPRRPIGMHGGTSFQFINASPAEALDIALQAAGGLDVRIGGGPSTVRQFLAADLIDHMHVVIVPIVLGRGERLWDGFEELEQRFNVEAVSSPSGVTHVTFTRPIVTDVST